MEDHGNETKTMKHRLSLNITFVMGDIILTVPQKDPKTDFLFLIFGIWMLAVRYDKCWITTGTQ
jgi:hypothetical protein